MKHTLRTPIVLTSTALLAVLATGCGDDGTDGTEATASFESPGDGAQLAGGIELAMSADGVVIAPAGDVKPGTGHFHVIADDGCAATGSAIARDADHVHFGSGAATGTIYLAPGKHSLCLQVGDGAHTALDVTDTIEVEVGIENREQWCDTVAEVDGMYDELDSSDAEFAAKKAGYENINRLFDQLDASADLVDAEAVAGVHELLDWGRLVNGTIIAADSEDAAVETLYGEDSAFADEVPADDTASTWISDNCGVEVDG